MTVFASVVFCAQIIEHTPITFALMFFAFSLLSALAFNVAGGFSRIAGSYVCFFSVLVVGLGVVWKAVLGQPGNSNVDAPQLGITLYTCSMLALLIVILATKKFDLRSHSVVAALGAEDLDFSRVAMGCIITAVSFQALLVTFGSSPGSALSALVQLNLLLPLGIILGTIGAVRNSRGARSVNLMTGSAMLLSFVQGSLAFSKQGMLTPPVCWMVAAFYMRLRLRVVHIVVLACFAYFALAMANPLSSLRDEVTEQTTTSDRFVILTQAYLHFGDLKARIAENEETRFQLEGGVPYFGTSQGGMLERLTMFPSDDELFAFTEKGHYVGYRTLFLDFENWIPHFIFPDKETGYSGNFYSREIGALPSYDTSTGISFSPVAEAYHVGGWYGIFLVLPVIWFLLFESMELVTGDLKKSPWGLFIIVFFAHLAPESLVGGLIFAIYATNLGLIATMIFCVKVAPVLGSLLRSPKPSLG